MFLFFFSFDCILFYFNFFAFNCKKRGKTKLNRDQLQTARTEFVKYCEFGRDTHEKKKKKIENTKKLRISLNFEYAFICSA